MHPASKPVAVKLSDALIEARELLRSKSPDEYAPNSSDQQLIRELSVESEELLKRDLQTHFDRLRTRDLQKEEEKTFNEALHLLVEENKQLRDAVYDFNEQIFNNRAAYRKRMFGLQRLMDRRVQEVRNNAQMRWEEKLCNMESSETQTMLHHRDAFAQHDERTFSEQSVQEDTCDLGSLLCEVERSRRFAKLNRTEITTLAYRCGEYEKLHTSIMARWTEMETLKCSLQAEFNAEDAQAPTVDIIDREVKERDHKRRLYMFLSGVNVADQEREELKMSIQSLQYRANRHNDIIQNGLQTISALEEDKSQLKKELATSQCNLELAVAENSQIKRQFTERMEALFEAHNVSSVQQKHDMHVILEQNADTGLKHGYVLQMRSVILEKTSERFLAGSAFWRWGMFMSLRLKRQRDNAMHKIIWLDSVIVEKVESLSRSSDSESARMVSARIREQKKNVQLRSLMRFLFDRNSLLHTYLSWFMFAQNRATEKRFLEFVAMKNKLQRIAETAMQECSGIHTSYVTLEEKLHQCFNDNEAIMMDAQNLRNELQQSLEANSELKREKADMAKAFDQHIQSVLESKSEVDATLKTFVLSIQSAGNVPGEIRRSANANVSLKDSKLSSFQWIIASRPAFVNDVFLVYREIQCAQRNALSPKDVAFAAFMKTCLLTLQKQMKAIIHEHLTDLEKHHFGVPLIEGESIASNSPGSPRRTSQRNHRVADYSPTRGRDRSST